MVGPDLLIALIVLLVIVLIWRGPKNLPKIGQALGRSVKDFRSEIGSNDEPPAGAAATTATPVAPPTPPTPPAPPKDEPTP